MHISFHSSSSPNPNPKIPTPTPTFSNPTLPFSFSSPKKDPLDNCQPILLQIILNINISMSKDQKDDFLRYGQGILLRGFKSQNERNDIGFLTAKGFADTTAKYETYKNLLYFKNYRNAIFQIIPAANFEINDELRKKLEINNEETPNVKILKARAKSEEEQFQLQIENKMRQQVCFGDTVIFKHVDSDTFLSGTIRPSNGSNGAFTVQVTKNLSEILIYKVLPFRSYERIGMPIPFDSPVKLLNTYNNGYLTFQKIGTNIVSKKLDLDKKPIMPDDSSYIIPVKTNSAESLTYECVTHFVDLSKATEDPMPWQFVLHMVEVQNDSLIQHDIIYFQHTQNGGVLSTQGKEIILKEMKVESGEELPFYQCLWEIQKHNETEDSYILRHLMSGMTLGIVKDSQGRPLRPQLFDITEGEAEGNLGWIELKLAKKEKVEINSSSLINIAYGEWCLDKIKDQINVEADQEDQKTQKFVSISKLNKLAVNELQYEVKKVKFTLEISKNCFTIKEIDAGLKKQVLFALSFHSKIIDLRDDLKWGHQESEEKISYIRMMQVTEKIKEIKDFLKNVPKELSDRQYIKPVFKRQMICKDLGISELLFELLFFMRKNFQGRYVKKDRKDKENTEIRKSTYIFEGKHNELEKFDELYNSIYEVIYELVRDNLLFKIYVSKWINFVIEDVLIENQQSQLNLLKELFKDNEFLVKNFVTDNLVKELADRMINQKDNFMFYEKKYLEIFRLFCIVGESINTSNQVKILNHFIKQLRTDDVRALYQVTLSKKDDEIYTEAAIDKNILKKRRFGDYYKICREEYYSAWEYFVEFLNLVADMTKGRNKTVESYMETMFTLDILSDLFEHYELHEAEVPIIRLLHNLYAESEKFYPIEKKKRISDYQKLKVEEVDVMTTTSEVKPWNPPLKRVLDCLQKKLSEFGPINPAEVLKNSNLYQILNFIWQTFNLGFWQKKEDVKAVLVQILKILEPYPPIVKNYAQYSIQSKENLLMMKCKLECMNIIQLILDYDLDLSVRYICKHFQNFNMPEKKRALINDGNTRILEYKIDNDLASKFIQEIPKDNIQLIESSILERMIELSKYNNPKLTSQSISIMQRVLLKKKKAIEDFCKQIFVCDPKRIDLMKFIEDKKNKFYTMQDQTLVNVNMANQAGNYVFIFKQDNKESGIMQDIYMMSQVIKNQYQMSEIRGIKTLESSGMFKKLGTERLLNFTDERTSSNIMKQSVLDAENIHLKVLQFILNCVDIPLEQLALKLLHLSYKFLVSLIWNFQDIKPSLIPYIPMISHHLKQNVGCIDFLKEMYDNNKTMLFNEANLLKFVKEICATIENEPDNSYYKSKLLDFFRFLIYCNGKSLKFNQIQILKVMQDDSYKKIILQITKGEIEKLVAKYMEDYELLQSKRNTNIVKIEPRLNYMITYFQILQSLIDDKNSVNMGKLKKRFPFDTLVDWVRASKNCWPLKRNIRAFLNRLYYFEPEVEIYMKKIIGFELDNVIEDLNQYILIKCKSNYAEFEGYIFENPVRFSYLESYLYLNLEENLFTLYELTTRKKIEEEMKTILHPIDNSSNDGPYNFIRICERLGWIKNYFADKKNVYTNSFIKFLLNKFRSIINDFDDNIYLPGMNIANGLGRAPTKPEKEKARVGLIEKIMNGDIGTFFVQATGEYNEKLPLVYNVPDKVSNPKDDKKPNQDKLLKKLREILKREKRQFKDADEEIDYKLNRLVRAIKLSPEAEAFLTNDYNNNLSNYSRAPAIFDYITIIIEMNSLNSDALPMKEKKFFLNLITGIVEQNNKVEREKSKPIDEWEADDWVASRDDLINIQNKLKVCQLGKFVTELLKENIWDNIEFADSILLCGISYLFGGNTTTQKNMIEEIGADNENKVMKNLQTLITKLGKFILKNIEESKPPVEDSDKSFSITTIDNYDFYEFNKRYVHRKNVFEPETTDQELYSKTCIRTYRRAFKFLQLLCENNNIQGKNFIRAQRNQNKSVNFIGLASKEIRNLFISLNTDICNVAMFLLDFILEVTQIPVKANQDSLMTLSFFQDVCALQSTFSKPENVSLKGFDGRENLIEDIYFKAIQIILSNFEGNEQKTFVILDSKLDPRFLMNILKKKLTQMKLFTKQNVIEYIDCQKECIFDDNMMAVINIIIIFKKLYEKLKDSSRIYSEYDKQREGNLQMYEFLEKCLLEIEIVNSGQPQTIIFPKYPVFNSLSANLRDAVMEKVSRTTHRDKIVSLLGYTSSIKTKIQSSYSLLKVEKITEQHMNDAFRISAIMSIVTCVYMILYYDVIINYGEADFSSNRIIGLGRIVLSLIQLSMSLVYAYYWLRFKIWEKPEKVTVQSGKSKHNDEAQETSNKYIKAIIEAIKKIASKLKIDVTLSLIHKALKGGDTKQPLYEAGEFYRVLVYVSVAFFGTFFHPAIYFLHIMDIFCYNPEIGDIFKAIGMNIKELAYVSFMGVVFTFVFCTVTFSNYQKNVYSGQESPEEMCQTMLDCILQLFVSGAIGETMEEFQIVRFSYDMLYGIFFGILFSNIISGIMLDAFGALREKNGELIHDKENFCYICNISRQALQKKRISFQTHINGKHFLWNYVFFIYFLNEKSPTDYSGMEYFITTQYNKPEEEMQIQWVPVGEPSEFDCKAKLEELTEQIGKNSEFLQENKGEIERIVQNFKEIAADYAA